SRRVASEGCCLLRVGCRWARARAPARRQDVPVAGVAVAALPLGIDRFAEVLEDEARAALRALTVIDHRAQLRPILRAPLLVVREVGTQVDRGELRLQPLPRAAAVLAHQTMALEQGEHDPRFAPRHARLVGEVVELDGFGERNLLEHDRHVSGFFDVGILAAEKVRLHPAVLDAIEERASRWKPVAAGAAGLLIVRLDRSRKVIVDDEAKVLLVDAEAEGVGRDDRLELVGHESILRLLALRPAACRGRARSEAAVTAARAAARLRAQSP